MAAIKPAYRFADLNTGDKFFVVGDYRYEYLSVAGDWNGGNCWEGSRKRYLHDNVMIEPKDKRKAGVNRWQRLRKTCLQHNIPVEQLRQEYRSALAKSHPLYPATREAATKELSPAAWNALQDLGLIICHHPMGAVEPMYLVSGEYSNRMFI